MSDSEDLSQYSDAESVFTDVESANSSTLPDQTLLKMAFSGAVHSRKCTAKDWRNERSSEFIQGPDCHAESELNKDNKSRSYTSRVRVFLKNMTSAGKKGV
jgi:hypothetical protein